MKPSRDVQYRHLERGQKGAALAISLIILLVLTLVVVSGSQEVVLQERMSAAVRDGHISLQAAEFALHKAEEDINLLTGTAGFSDTGSGGYYSKGKGPANLFNSANWESSKTRSGTMTVDGQAVSYAYFIEETDVIEVPDENMAGVNMMGYGQTTGGGDVTAFRVVARGTGMSGNAERILVAYIGKRL